MSVASLSPGTLHRSRGQVLLTIAGVTQAMGSVDLSQNTTVTDNDVTTNEFYNKVVIDSQVDEMTFELTLGFHQVSRFALMIANLSDYHAVAQLAAQDVEVEFDLASGAFPIIVPLGYRLTSGHVVTDANDTDYVEGVHYTVHGGDRGSASSPSRRARRLPARSRSTRRPRRRCASTSASCRRSRRRSSISRRSSRAARCRPSIAATTASSSGRTAT